MIAVRERPALPDLPNRMPVMASSPMRSATITQTTQPTKGFVFPERKPSVTSDLSNLTTNVRPVPSPMRSLAPVIRPNRTVEKDLQSTEHQRLLSATSVSDRPAPPSHQISPPTVRSSTPDLPSLPALKPFVAQPQSQPSAPSVRNSESPTSTGLPSVHQPPIIPKPTLPQLRQSTPSAPSAPLTIRESITGSPESRHLTPEVRWMLQSKFDVPEVPLQTHNPFHYEE